MKLVLRRVGKGAWRLAIAATVLAVVIAVADNSDYIQAAPASPTITHAPRTAAVPAAMRALAKLHSYGYSIDTKARAERSIRHWQKVNGLTVDGIVGPEVLHSLGLDKPAVADSAPATRAPTPVVHVPPADAPPAGDVEAIIRDVWPDDLEDWAVRIAKRESNLQPGVRNSICWGLFQIYWTQHRAWLAQFGVTDPHQLLDARTNAEMAYQLYLIDGAGPWAL